MATRVTMLAMAELAAARAEVEAAAVADAAHAAAVELEALRASSTGNSVSAADGRDNELKLVREPAREQTTQWAVVPPTTVAAQTSMDVSAARLTEITAFTGDAALAPQTGSMVTMGSRPLSGMSVPVTGGLPSPRPTTSSGPQ
jgi:hypothetical protein